MINKEEFINKTAPFCKDVDFLRHELWEEDETRGKTNNDRGRSECVRSKLRTIKETKSF